MLRELFIASLLAAALALPSTALVNKDLDEHWELFKQTHKKEYSSQEEETLRRMVWEGHVSYIAKHNREYDLSIHTFTLGLNFYADMSNEEFVAVMNGYRGVRTAEPTMTFSSPSHVTVPDSVDWRTEGYVTAIKDQGQCGSCWAFSTTGSLEGQHFKATQNLVSLSEQNLVDCSKPEGNQGCNGGLMDQAFTYIKKNGGIDTEASYPYTAKNGKCHYKAADSGANDTGFVDIPAGNEAALQSAVATVGPISVAIDASQTSFQLYKSGVYNERSCSSTQLDHGVLAVGYDTTSAGQAYWIVKNSWGTSWGQKGYIWMSRNKNNQCGIATAASYPTV